MQSQAILLQWWDAPIALTTTVYTRSLVMITHQRTLWGTERNNWHVELSILQAEIIIQNKCNLKAQKSQSVQMILEWALFVFCTFFWSLENKCPIVQKWVRPSFWRLLFCSLAIFALIFALRTCRTACCKLQKTIFVAYSAPQNSPHAGGIRWSSQSCRDSAGGGGKPERGKRGAIHMRYLMCANCRCNVHRSLYAIEW